MAKEPCVERVQGRQEAAVSCGAGICLLKHNDLFSSFSTQVTMEQELGCN